MKKQNLQRGSKQNFKCPKCKKVLVLHNYMVYWWPKYSELRCPFCEYREKLTNAEKERLFKK